MSSLILADEGRQERQWLAAAHASGAVLLVSAVFRQVPGLPWIWLATFVLGPWVAAIALRGRAGGHEARKIGLFRAVMTGVAVINGALPNEAHTLAGTIPMLLKPLAYGLLLVYAIFSLTWAAGMNRREQANS
jgi:hypothetical protein